MNRAHFQLESFSRDDHPQVRVSVPFAFVHSYIKLVKTISYKKKAVEATKQKEEKRKKPQARGTGRHATNKN
jgi:hypothetical protein